MGLFETLSPRWYAAAGESARVASRLGRHERVAEVVDSLRGDRRPETAAARAELLARLGVPAIRAGLLELYQRIQTELAAAQPLVGDSPTAHAWLMRLRGYEALVAGDTSTYLQQSEAAAVALQSVRDHRTALTLQTSVGFANIALGRYAEAERVLRIALGGAQRLGLATVELVAKHNLGYAVALLGRLEEGILLETECIAGAIVQKDRWIECVSETYLADLMLRAGRSADAERAARRAAELSDPPNQVLALALLARIELALGKTDDARSTAQRSHALLEELGSVEDGEAMARLGFVEVNEAVGNTDAALQELGRARDRLLARANKIADPELRESFLTQVPENARTLQLADARGV
jgi:tetratricopeptide (TPR) repeat protein